MPVVRSRSGLRTEAGRGYPRLKWSDINKSTIIANSLICDKHKEGFDVLSHAPNPSHFSGNERRAEAKRHSSPEWNRRRHGVLIQSDGESDENSSDNSLICSDLRVSPDNGKVRMALTVPLNRLTSPQNRHQSVVQSTLRIKHTTLHTSKDSKGVEQHYLNSGICTAGRCSSRTTRKNLETRKGCYFEANVNKLDYFSDENRKKRFHTHIPDMSPFPFGYRDSNLFLCENKDSIRPPSFWHDVKACKMGYLASQKNRLRDGTFIISPSTSDSNLDQKRRGLKKLPRNPLYLAQEGYLSEDLARPLPVPFGLRTLPLCTKLEKCSKSRDLECFTSDTTPLEVRLRYQHRRPIPVTFTSASHSGVRCYPPLQCHPLPKCHPFPLSSQLPHFYKVQKFAIPECPSQPPHPTRHTSHLEKGLSKRKSTSSSVGGLTICNRHASMDSDDEQPSSRANAQRNKKLDLKSTMGQRVSSGDASSIPTKRPSNPQQTSSASPSRTGTPPSQSPTVHAAGNKAVRGKKSLKTSLVEIPSKKTFQNKSKYSNSSVSTSPATLHGRVLQKTATVSPAPHKAAENSSNTLTRFGFKNSPLITSGESTDSVNSILSDAQTTSDANSNIFDFGDKNRNCSNDLESKLITHHSNVHSSSTLNVRSISPCTISQASSGVTSSALNGKIKAQTKHLPSPQTATVKEMNKNSKKSTVQNGSFKSRYSSPVTKKNSSPQPNPSVMPKDHRSKIPQNATKSSLSRVQKPSKDIDTSNRSLSTIDSGLGSSLESDKLRSPKLSSLRKGKVLDTGQGSTDTKETIILDLSDEWLKEKHSEQDSRTEFNRTSKIFEDSLNQNIPKNTPKFPKDSFKDKRDSNITYGMARQKFAPYSRYRFSYQNVINKSSNGEKGTVKESSKTNVSGGVVRNRIAQLEKTPTTSTTTTNTSSPSRILPKKPVTRPTAIEKTPILVNLKSENTIELSRSICRRLEYNEGKSSLLEATKDKTESYLIEVPTTAQDLLMVDSYEVKRNIENSEQSESVENSESVVDTNKMSVSLPDEKSLKTENETSEEKTIKDISECENTTKRFSAEIANCTQNHADTGLLHLPLESTIKVLSPDSSKVIDGSKVLSPDGSETSFEVLESRSVDISPREESEITSKSDGYLTQLVASLANSSGHVSDLNSSGFIDSSGLVNSSGNINSSEHVNCSSEYAGAKHSQNSPLRTLPLKKCKQDSNTKEESNCEEPIDSAQNDTQDHFIGGPRSVMESSIESNPSESNRMSDSFGDRWTVSGKCTPSVGSTRGDAEQDFLIDDEISDQPGLTFGDDLDASLFGDEDLFSDLSSPSATHILSKAERSRHGSLGTASSLGPDDLMLDYDPEDSKQYGNPKKGGSSKKPLKTITKNISIRTDGESFDILIPGPRYEEEVLSPVACDILSEWSAILSGTAQPLSPQRSPEPCVSQQTGVVSTACSNSLGVGLSSSPTQTTSVTTHQPLTTESPTLSRSGSLRSRTCSVGPDFASADYKRSLNLKPPRQGVSSEHDGGLNIDRTTLHYICQDVTTMKTLLHRLRRVLQVTDTINPFDANLKASLYLNLGVAESTDKEDPNSVHEVVQQNVDLKRQVILLQQRLEEKDRTIRSLQQQLTQSMQKSTTSSIQTLTNSSYLASPDDDHSSSSRSLSNAATQTERSSHRSSPFSLASMSRTSSVEDGLGPTVSFEHATTSNIMNENTTPPLDELSENTETVSSPKKTFPGEHPGVSNQPKLSLVPLTPTVEGSIAS